MNDISAFVHCRGRTATHRVNLRQYVSGAPSLGCCFTHLDGDLLLCDSCTAFWLEHQGARDLTTLERAVELRKAPSDVGIAG
jgi:hypothetical protein